MRQFPVGYLLPVELHALDVDGLVRLARSIDDKLLARRHVQHRTAEQRRADDVLCRTGIERIETQRREDVPGRHLAAVIVAGVTAGSGIVELAAYLLHQLLSAPGLTRKVIEIDGMVARLVAVSILADEPAGIAVHLAARLRQGEVLVELLDERLHAAEQLDKALRVLRHKPHVLPGVALHEAGILVAQRVERLYPLPFVVLGLEEARGRVEEVAVELAAPKETLVVLLLAKLLGHRSHAPVVEGLLHRDAHAGALQVLRHVAVLLPQLEGAVVVRAGAALHHCSVGTLHVQARQLRQDSIGHDGDGMVADHAVVVLPPEVPDGQVAIRLMMQHHVAHELCGNVGVE